MTRTGTTLSQGDIVLVPIPFTDLSSQKRRPVIVVSNNQYHRSTGDMLVVAMTSNPAAAPYSFAITSSDLESGNLNRPGTVRVDKLFTLSQGLVAKVFGRVNTAVLGRIRAVLEDLVSAKP
jgi:mRNA interferase MazF